MSYQVLARKWRPRTFAEMVGQQHVLRALINALDHNRLHHAYLFTGTRGVGKTTIARIFAKSLNCERGVSSQPCGVCGACREVDEGRFIDLIEVDAASRTKVEDTRELLDNVQYAPTRGRYKVYLIDEVHMLSGHSFNALLKTLEEPPPHVKFLLATTDPQKLPVTVLSRCLQFSLKRLPTDLIAAHLQRILEQENIAFEAPALQHLAQAADGSMRDALSLLDQAIAFGAGALRDAEVRGMLGSIDRDHVWALARALASQDARSVLDTVAVVAESAPDFAALLAELLSALHRIALAQAVPGAIDSNDSESAAIAELSRQLTPEDVQLYYQIALLGRRDLPLAPDPRSSLEMTLLRMLAFRPASVAEPKPAPAAAQGVREGAAAVAAPRPAARPVPTAMPARPAVQRPADIAPPPQPAVHAVREPSGPLTASTAADASDWVKTVAHLQLDPLARQLAANCVLVNAGDAQWELSLAPAHGSLYNKKFEERLRAALQNHLGKPIALKITIGTVTGETPARAAERESQERLRQAQQSIQDDANVKALLDTFNGRIVPNSIQPAD